MKRARITLDTLPKPEEYIKMITLPVIFATAIVVTWIIGVGHYVDICHANQEKYCV
jgi:hypothetical protein